MISEAAIQPENSKCSEVSHFPDEVIKELGSYVYIYVDPRNAKPFYVGNGCGNRIFSHLRDQSESDKVRRISEIRHSGCEPRIEILRHGLTDDQATLVEASVIDLIGLEQLTNGCRGFHSKSLGRISVSDVLMTYSADRADCVDPMLLITVNRLYRSGMTDLELYEAARGVWKLGKRREKAKFACAVFQGVVREVYEIKNWQTAGTATYFTRDSGELSKFGRWEFTGKKASELVRKHYNFHSVKHLLGASSQNPVRYVNC